MENETVNAAMDEDFPYNVKFVLDEYTKQTYGMEDYDCEIGFRCEMDIPYAGMEFAVRRNGAMESNLRVDNGKPWEETLAKRLLEDENVRKGERMAYIGNEAKPATLYSLIYKNPNAVMFMPTVDQPISDAVNVTTDFGIEFRFALGDGYTVSVLHRGRTGDGGACSFYDEVRWVIENISNNPDALYELLSENGNAELNECEDTLMVMAASAELGRIDELEFEMSRVTCRDFVRALSCVRLVEFKETIERPTTAD